jgi:hypothetical protein
MDHQDRDALRALEVTATMATAARAMERSDA